MVLNNKPEIRNTRVNLCLDCGKCTVVCPIAHYNPEFNPRLIVQRNLGAKTPGKEDETIWACLNCSLCLERCNYRVEFPEFVRVLRTEALNQGTRLQCSHGGALQALMHIMTKENLRQERLGWLPPDSKLSGQYDTIFFTGCTPYFDKLFSDLEVNTLDSTKGIIKLLNCASIPFNLLPNERCCGHDLLIQGDKDSFLSLAHANIAEFTRMGVQKVITSCPECYYSLKVEYPRILGHTVAEVFYWTDVLAPLLPSLQLHLGEVKQKVTYHDPCLLGRGCRTFDTPRQVLNAIKGLEFTEIEPCRERALCCGSSSWVHCGAANRRIQEELLIQAKSTGAKTLVTSCPKCQIHLKCAQKSGNGQLSDIKIQDLATLAAQSLDQEVS